MKIEQTNQQKGHGWILRFLFFWLSISYYNSNLYVMFSPCLKILARPHQHWSQKIWSKLIPHIENEWDPKDQKKTKGMLSWALTYIFHNLNYFLIRPIASCSFVIQNKAPLLQKNNVQLSMIKMRKVVQPQPFVQLMEENHFILDLKTEGFLAHTPNQTSVGFFSTDSAHQLFKSSAYCHHFPCLYIVFGKLKCWKFSSCKERKVGFDGFSSTEKSCF